MGGVGLDPITLSRAQEMLRAAVRQRARPALHVVTVNLDFLALAERDPSFRDVLNRADLVCADGEAVRWLARFAGHRIPERVAGADLTAWIVDGGIPQGRIFLLGSTDDVLAAIRARAAAHGAAVAGWASPLREAVLSSTQSSALVHEVNGSGADILLVALGAPLQEQWIAEHLPRLQVAVAIGVGGSLDFAAGAVKRAPVVLQRLGLEWLHRLVGDPRRLWDRYVHRDIPYFARELARSVRRPGRRAGLRSAAGWQSGSAARVTRHDSDVPHR